MAYQEKLGGVSCKNLLRDFYIKIVEIRFILKNRRLFCGKKSLATY
jgi:hypothetical protein